MGQIINFDEEEINPIKEAEFRKILKTCVKSWRLDWAMDEEDNTMMLIANAPDGRTIVGHITSCFEWVGHKKKEA